MEQAIKKAIEGGYKAPFGKPYKTKHYATQAGGLNLTAISQDLNIPTVLLDPLFWQCLGKALGWFEAYPEREIVKSQYLIEWHRFIDHVAEGKDVDSFFKELLK